MSDHSPTLYGSPLSGHTHRVELFLLMLGVPYRFVITPPDARATVSFKTLNPLKQIPVLEDGELVLPDSNAILVYLAKRYAPNSPWLPEDPITASQVQRWLSIAAGELANGPNAARLMAVFGKPGHREAIADVSKRLLDFMDEHLRGRSYLVGSQPTIADLACYTYVAHGPEGGLDLQPYADVRTWLRRIEALPAFKPMQSSPINKRA